MDDLVRRRLSRLVPGFLALVVAACAGGGTSPSPSPVELVLRTTPAGPPGQVVCPLALLADVRLAVDPTRSEPIVAVAADGTRRRLVFRSGTRAAWDPATGAVVISMPEGEPRLVRPDERISFGGGHLFSGEDDVFFACSFG